MHVPTNIHLHGDETVAVERFPARDDRPPFGVISISDESGRCVAIYLDAPEAAVERIADAIRAAIAPADPAEEAA